MSLEKLKTQIKDKFSEVAAHFGPKTYTLPSPNFSNLRSEKGAILFDVTWTDIEVSKDEYKSALRTCPYIKAAKDITELCKERVEDWQNELNKNPNMSDYETITFKSLSRAALAISLHEAGKQNFERQHVPA